MPTSGTTSWSLNRDQVVTAALRKIGAIPQGGVATGGQLNDALDSLNALVKTLQADGMPLWKINTGTFATVTGTYQYPIGVGISTPGINGPKPLRVLQAQYTQLGGTNIPMQVYNMYDENNLPRSSSGTTGIPIIFSYQPLRTTGMITLWPAPIDSTTTISFQYQSPYEDMSASTNDFDFPSEWITPLIYMLAWMLAPEYGVPLLDRQLLQKEAEYWHQYALSMGVEEGSVYIHPQRNFKV